MTKVRYYAWLVFQVSKNTVKSFHYVFFETDEIRTRIKICYSYISIFTAAKPK